MLSLQNPQSLGQLPEQASTFASDVDNLFMFVWWVSAFFFFLVVGVLLYSAVRYRRRTEDQAPATTATHNTTLEIVWTLVPLVIVMVIFAWGWVSGKDMLVAPGDAQNYGVQARKWNWDLSHPGQVGTSGTLYAKLGEPAKLTMRSKDLLHSFFVPAFRVKRDVVPGRTQYVWFEPTLLGTYDILCTEYCGDGHSRMRAQVEVLDETDWNKKPWAKRPERDEDWGEQLYQQKCRSCHALDNVAGGTCPPFYKLWDPNREGLLADGSSYKVTDEYFIESVRQPNAKKVKGYENAVMTQFTETDVPDEQVNAIKLFLQEKTREQMKQ